MTIDAQNKRRPHGWRLIKNYGNYGAYGWGFGLWHSTVREMDDMITSDVIIQLGPFKVMFAKVRDDH